MFLYSSRWLWVLYSSRWLWVLYSSRWLWGSSYTWATLKHYRLIRYWLIAWCSISNGISLLSIWFGFDLIWYYSNYSHSNHSRWTARQLMVLFDGVVSLIVALMTCRVCSWSLGGSVFRRLLVDIDRHRCAPPLHHHCHLLLRVLQTMQGWYVLW